MEKINTTTNDLQNMVRDYQQGDEPLYTDSETIEDINNDNGQETIPSFGGVQFSDNPQSSGNEEQVIVGSIGSLDRGLTGQSSYDSNLIRKASEVGFGKSRFDTRTGFQQNRDIEDLRAQEQSWLGKVTNGLVKGGVTTLTTAANSTVGLIAGLGSSMFELGKELVTDEKLSAGNVFNAGVNNAVSNFLIKLQNGMEEIAPNYKTEEERTEEYQDQWYRHMLSGNFIGDSFLKNLGFTVGSVAGGMAWNKILGSVYAAKMSSDLMKGAVSASVAGDAQAMSKLKSAADALRKAGNLNNVDVEVIMKNIKDAGKSIKNAQLSTQLLGATTAAMGEGTVEGIMARNEFMEEFYQKMDTQYAQAYNSLEDRMRKIHPEWFVDAWDIDANGEPVMKSILVSEEGKRELYKQQLQLSENYNKTKEFAEAQGDVLARTTFLLNLPILMSSNLVQFGRTFGGGWTTARRGIPKLSGNAGTLRPEGNKVLKAAFGSAKVGLTEASEEMLQGFVSSGSKGVADARLTAFNDLGYDERAALKAVDGMYPFFQSGKDYLGDVKNWQEGALGAITGLLGLPSARIRGSKSFSDWVSNWNGGVIGEIARAKSEYKAAQTAADKLNSLVNSKEFKDRWNAYVRHLAYDDKMSEAAENNDKYAWHTEDENQLISDVIDFAEAGRLNDLYDFVDNISDIKSSNQDAIDEIKAFIAPKDDTGRNISDSMSNEYVLEKVQSQAKKIKDVIDNYREVYNDIASIAPQSTDSKRFKEMLFTSMQVKAFEERFHTMLTDTLTAMDELFQRSASRNPKTGGDITDYDKARQNLQSLRMEYGDALSGGIGLSILDKVHVSVANKRLDEAEKALRTTITKYNLVGQAREKIENTISQLQDMRKIASARREFIRKITNLRNMSDEKFDSLAMDSDKAQQRNSTMPEEQSGTDPSVADPRTVDGGITPPAGFDADAQPQLSFDDSTKKYAVMNNFSRNMRTVPTASDSTVVQAIAGKMIVKMFNRGDITSDDMLTMNSEKLPSVEELFGELEKLSTFKNITEGRQELYNQAVDLARRVMSRVAEDMDKMGMASNNLRQSEQGQELDDVFGRQQGLPATRRQPPVVDEQALAEKKAEEEKRKEEAALAAAQNAREISGHDEPNGADAIIPAYKVGDKVMVEIISGRGKLFGTVVSVDYLEAEKNYFLKVEDTDGSLIAWVPQDFPGLSEYEPVELQPNVTTTITKEVRAKKGDYYVPSTFDVVKDSDGFIHVTRNSGIFPSVSKRELEKLGIQTAEDMFGDYGDNNSVRDDMFDDEDTFAIKSVVIRPDGTVYIEFASDEVDAIETPAAATIAKYVFPELFESEGATTVHAADKEIAFEDDFSEEPQFPDAPATAYVAQEDLKDEFDYDDTDALVEATESDAKDYVDIDSLETNARGEQTYYNTAIPELSISTMREIRRHTSKGAFGAVGSVEYRTFIEENESYRDLWNYLLDHNAFENMDRLVVSRDKPVPIHFVVDPNAPVYTDADGVKHTSVFLAYLGSDGQYKIFNVLRENFSKKAARKWAGLSELRKDILSDYEKYRKSPEFDGKAFVFSKTSNAWARRAGYINYELSRDFVKDVAINRKQGYDPNASIIGINNEGEIKLLYGKGYKMRDKFYDVLQETFDGKHNKTLRAGNIYYLANGVDDYSMPIRLNVEHYNENTAGRTGYGFDQINSIVDKLVEISRKFSSTEISGKNYEERMSSETDAREAANKEKAEVMQELNKYLDIHGIVVTFGYASRKIPTFRLFYYKDQFDDKGNYSRGELVNSEWMASNVTADDIKEVLASLNRSFSIDMRGGDVSGHIHQLAENGLLTSNAEKMRSVGTDIYFDSYNPKTHTFDSKSRNGEAYGVDNPDTLSDGVDSSGDFFGFVDAPTAQTESESSEKQWRSYDSLSDMQKERLKRSGYTAEQFNLMDANRQNRLLECS